MFLNNTADAEAARIERDAVDDEAGAKGRELVAAVQGCYIEEESKE